MIALRKLFQVFGRGTLKFLNPSNRKILAYLRDLDRGDGSHETVLCVANLSRFAQPVSLDLAEFDGFEPVEMLGYVSFPGITDQPYALALAPYSFLWLELQPPAARQSDMPDTSLAAAPATVPSTAGPNLAVEVCRHGWKALFGPASQALIESELAAWLPQQRWFGAKTRRILSVRLANWVELTTGDIDEVSHGSDAAISPAIFFADVAYADGASETYQIPLAASRGDDAGRIATDYPRSVILSATAADEPAILHDATVIKGFRQGMLALIARNASLSLSPLSPFAAEVPSPVPLTVQPGEAAEERLPRKPPPNKVKGKKGMDRRFLSQTVLSKHRV